MYSSPPYHKKENLVEKKKSSKFVTHVVQVEISTTSPPINKHHLKYKFKSLSWLFDDQEGDMRCKGEIHLLWDS